MLVLQFVATCTRAGIPCNIPAAFPTAPSTQKAAEHPPPSPRPSTQEAAEHLPASPLHLLPDCQPLSSLPLLPDCQPLSSPPLPRDYHSLSPPPPPTRLLADFATAPPTQEAADHRVHEAPRLQRVQAEDDDRELLVEACGLLLYPAVVCSHLDVWKGRRKEGGGPQWSRWHTTASSWVHLAGGGRGEDSRCWQNPIQPSPQYRQLDRDRCEGRWQWKQ